MPMVVVMIIVSAYLLLLPYIRKILTNDIANIISLLISVIGVVLSSFAVYYGRKSYCVAQSIFEEGIKMNKKKVLDQVGWELALNLVIPLSTLKNSLLDLKKNDKDVKITDLYSVLKSIKLPNNLNYCESHMSEIWDSLTICNSSDEAFNIIRKVLETYSVFHNKTSGIITTLEGYRTKLLNKGDEAKQDVEYRNEERQSAKKKKDISTLTDLCNAGVIEVEYENEFLDSLTKILDYVNKLPNEIGIEEKIKRVEGK
jgi:hypothetical protein